MDPKQEKRKAFIINFLYFIIMVLVIYIVLKKLFPVFLPFIIGLFIAMILNPMIHFASTMDGVMKNLEKIKENSFKCGKKELNEIDATFDIRDNKNCKRVYEFVKNN